MHSQRGIGMLGFLLLAVGIILSLSLALKIVPAYLHQAEIKQIFKTMATDAQLQEASISDIRAAYQKRASVDSITDISAQEISISKDGKTLILSAQYSLKVALIGNASLLLEFNPSSAP